MQTDAVRGQDGACSNVSALSHYHCALLSQHKCHVTCGRELEQDAHNGEDVECGVVGRGVQEQRACLTVDEFVLNKVLELQKKCGMK